jgi:predicted NAD/FAD-binding protein
MKIAIVGSGISGLAAAHALRGRAELTLLEAGDYFGGHTHTVDLSLTQPDGSTRQWGVDTGFLVFNERTYPQLIALFKDLEVPTAHSDMSFSVQVPGAVSGTGRAGTLEWSGSSLNTVFAQRSNLLRPRFLGMLRDVLRFNRLATALALRGSDADLMQPLAEFLDQHRFGAEFRQWYFLPMLGCIWSCPTQQMLRFPVATMIRFCHNHGLIQVNNRPQWWTVKGGARHYVEKIIQPITDKRLNSPVQALNRQPDGVKLTVNGQTEQFDHVVLACHSDQALALLSDATGAEREVLGAIRYQQNQAVLHTDVSVLPSRRAAWSAWNYERAQPGREDAEEARVCLHYLINMLQPVPFAQPVVVSLNPLRPIDPAQVHGRFEYAHPVFDLAAIRARAQVAGLQGQQRTWFCGAWTGYGFHEDGLKSGLAVAAQLAPLLDGGAAAAS